MLKEQDIDFLCEGYSNLILWLSASFDKACLVWASCKPINLRGEPKPYLFFYTKKKYTVLYVQNIRLYIYLHNIKITT